MTYLFTFIFKITPFWFGDSFNNVIPPKLRKRVCNTRNINLADTVNYGIVPSDFQLISISKIDLNVI